MINDDGECSTVGGFEAQVYWPGPKVGSHLALVPVPPNELDELSQWQFTATLTAP